MKTFNNYDTLEIVEEWANDWGLISSEEQASELFDEIVLPSVLEEYSSSDEVAINEAFSIFMDGLQKDGQIHDLQYMHYEYIGEMS